MSEPLPTIPIEAAARDVWDVIVVGAGPAGSSAAIEAADRGGRVLLVDRAMFPREKVCGCCLNATAVEALACLGVRPGMRSAGSRPLRELRLVAGGGRTARLPLAGSLALSRGVLDALLLRRAAGAGVSILPRATARSAGLLAGERRVSLEAQDGGGTVTARARIVVVADGLGGRFLGAGSRPATTPRSRIGLGTIVDPTAHDLGNGTVLMACARRGYVGMVRLEDGRIDVAAAVDPHAVRESGGASRAIDALLREAGIEPSPDLLGASWRGTPPLSRRRAPAAERLLIAGDAAAFVEPFTGEGIAWALLSGRAAGRHAADALERGVEDAATRWSREHRRLLRRRHATCRAVAALLRRPRATRLAVALVDRHPSLAHALLRATNLV